VKIGITGVHAGCNRSPGLSVAKALRHSGCYDIVAIDYDNLATGLFLPIFTDCEVIPWNAEPDKLYVEISKIHKKHNIDILFPCLNNDIIPFSDIASNLSLLGIHTLLPFKTSVNARNKIQLAHLAGQIGLRYPRTIVCYTEGDLEAALEQIGCPCVVKGPECGVFPVRSKELFDYHTTYCATSFDFPILVQEWMEGEEFSVFSLCDKSSAICVDATAKKIGIADDGESWMSVIVDGSEFMPYMIRMTEALDWIGPIEFDLLRSGGEIYLLDVNPRFPSWIDGLAKAGCNAPVHATYLAMNSVPQPQKVSSFGMVLFKDFEDVCFPVNSMIFE
jgi:carbamoyl-phosphate synthase large subunit